MEIDKLRNFASCCKEQNFSYRFIIESLLFITKAAFFLCSNLNHAKTMIMYDKDYKILGVVNLGKIKKWLLVRTSSNWVGVNFVDGNYPIESFNFAFDFKSSLNLSLNNFKKFRFMVLDAKQQLLKKLSELDFRIRLEKG